MNPSSGNASGRYSTESACEAQTSTGARCKVRVDTDMGSPMNSLGRWFDVPPARPYYRGIDPRQRLQIDGVGHIVHSENAVRLTSLVSRAGCAAKMGPATLAQMLLPLSQQANSNLIVGLQTSDDA